MEAKDVKFKLLKRIIFETDILLMSHITIDFGRPFDIEFVFPSSYLFPGVMTCFTLLE